MHSAHRKVNKHIKRYLKFFVVEFFSNNFETICIFEATTHLGIKVILDNFQITDNCGVLWLWQVKDILI